MNIIYAFISISSTLLATVESTANEQSRNLTGPQLFTIAVAIFATFAGVIVAKVLKDKDDKHTKE